MFVKISWAFCWVSLATLVGCGATPQDGGGGDQPLASESGVGQVGAALVPACNDPCSSSCSGAINVRTDWTIAAKQAAYQSGDPIVDDFALLRAAADYAGEHPGSTLIYPGNFNVNRHSSAASPSLRVLFSHLKDVQLIGCGATISVQGNFTRTTLGDASVIPFDIVDSSNFIVRGFSLEGNVAQMSKAAGLTESNSHGIRTSNCSNYSLTDLSIHGFATDGLLLGTGSSVDYPGPPYRQDTNAYVRNVTSSNNGRDALSVIQVDGAVFQNSIFTKSGVTGSYGGHSPMAGVDIEPDYPPDQIVGNKKTGRIFFDNVEFSGNLGSQFNAAYPSTTADVTLKNSTVKVLDPAYFMTVIMTVSDGLIENTTIDTGTGSGYVNATYCGLWSAATAPRTTIRDSQITTEGYGLLALPCSGVAHDVDVTVDGVTFTGKPGKPWNVYMPYINQPYTDFLNNTIFISKGSYFNWGGHYNVTSLVQGMRLAAHNTWKTDLVGGQPAGPSGTIAPADAANWVSYNSGLVAQDAYQSGVAIVPMGSGTWTTGTPYNHYSQ